jgi:PhoPQ-activated pathogenicity-related protein
MDAVQEFSKQTLKHEVKRFVVSGASKRGWTTWLTGASDNRVAAIAPMVIDVLNMPVNLDYQVKMWKTYSVQIEDYVKLGIPQTVHSEKGDAITAMVDPYSYRKKLTMPKLIMMGTNDEYWTVDAIKHYIDSIPGQNFIHYVPNVGHDLGDKKQALAALSAFFGETLSGTPYTQCQPDLSYSKKGITLKVKATPDVLVDAILWSTSSEDTDFRNDQWTGKSLELKKKSAVITTTQPFPATGYRAFYLDLKYTDPNGGEYTQSTRMYVSDNDEVFVK